MKCRRHISTLGIAIATTRVGQTLKLDWGDAFHLTQDVPVAYSVVIGTLNGYSDVLDLDYTSGHEYDVSIPSETLMTANPTELFIKIKCIDVTGLSTVLETVYKLTK